MMMQKDAKYLKELEAQKKRADALKHLQQQGQSVVINNGLHKAAPVVNTRADNTLELLFKQKIASSKSAAVSDVERTAKAAILKQQDSFLNTIKPSTQTTGTPQPLPEEWKEVVDKQSGKAYYWNLVTNETTWERPTVTTVPPTSSSSSSASSALPVEADLPHQWVKKMHPATQQAYYLNPETKQSSSEHPLKSAAASTSTSSSSAPPDGKKRSLTESGGNEATRKKGRALPADIDPLDPTGGEVPHIYIHSFIQNISSQKVESRRAGSSLPRAPWHMPTLTESS